jgi:spore germination protein KA
MNTKDIIKELYELKESMPDLIIKDIKAGLFSHVFIVTNEAVSSGDKVNDFILKYFSNKSIVSGKFFKNLKRDIEENIPAINYKEVKSRDSFMELLFSGFTLVVYKDEAIAYETRAELDRGVTEPTGEPVIRGPKDSFTENYNKNLGLIRKRIKSEHLCLQELNVGKQTKSKVGIMYMNNICEEEVVNEVKKSLEDINIDGVMDVNNFKSFFNKKNHTLFPTLLYTEKPDDTCRFLLDGRIIVTMENSPTVLVAPTFFIDFFHSSEDYYHKPFFSSFLRFIRFIAYFLAIITPALFIAIITYDQEILPVSLLINFTVQRSQVPFPAIVEAFILMFTFELLYEGDARTPSNRGTSLSILGALILGDAAVQAGIISPIMVIVIAVSAISNLVFIYYDIQGSIRLWRYILMILSALFGIVGFMSGFILLLINLCTIKTFGKPYLLPLSPFLIKDQGNALLRRELKKIETRPSYLSKKNITKEVSKE